MLDRIVEVFCEVNDFCKAFLPQWEAFLIGTGGPAPRGPQPGLSPSEIITLLLVLHSSGFKYLKSFYHEGFKGRVATYIERIQFRREAPWTRSARTARVSV